MAKYIKNISGETRSFLGVQVNDDASYLIPASKEIAFAENSNINVWLAAGDAQMSEDGTAFLSNAAENIQMLHGYKTTRDKVDGRQIVAVNRIPVGNTIYPTGIADNLTSGAYGTGTELILESGSYAKEFQLLHHYYAIGGRAIWEGSDLEHYIDGTLIAPASSGFTEEAGDFDKVALGGGASVYVPAAVGEGDWKNADINSKKTNTEMLEVTPVPVAGNTGYFNYDSDTNVISLVSNPAAPDGGYNLYDFDANLFSFCRRCWGRKQDGAESVLEQPDVVGKLLYNFWKIKFELKTRTGSPESPAKVGIVMTTAVKKNL